MLMLPCRDEPHHRQVRPRENCPRHAQLGTSWCQCTTAVRSVTVCRCVQLLWYLEVYPTLSDDDKPVEVIQNAGDVIFVPRGWWHMVRGVRGLNAVL
jgi:hypothetical protein